MSNPSTAVGEHGQLSGRLLDACQLQLGIKELAKTFRLIRAPLVTTLMRDIVLYYQAQAGIETEKLLSDPRVAPRVRQ
jgi:hypothetical protein